ncbi:hypothetical protein NLY44_05580 [Mesorhizobium sp. C089B]|uniref:hypothetical protein n=1 Tax=Mesorhizobium sp. C089B TaxID=2956823 RepID=UPI0025776BFC|nr:hypothetical protein [Mesorhizobium sp. C089B]WJI52154.1 hypothetical protein NLY44_05580 [Mesorhizobium sp. C089B]
MVFVDPDIYHENEKEQMTSFEQFAQTVISNQINIITGGDRSGKSLLAKKTQTYLDSSQQPAVLVKGRSIKNADIAKLVESCIAAQYGAVSFPSKRFSVVIDDFDECTLPDRIKESIIIKLSNGFQRVILYSFTSATSVLFTSDELPDPQVFNINQLANDKIYNLVVKWKGIGSPQGALIDDREVLSAYEKLQLIFDQSEIEKSAYSAVTFLELMETAAGGDIAISSFASCYDTLVTNRLQRAGIDWQTFDEAKNFLSHVAYRSFFHNESKSVPSEVFDDVLATFEKKYLSSKASLKKMALASFLTYDDESLEYEFREEYLWFFLCARYVARELAKENAGEYSRFVSRCTKNIFHKKYANIAIFIAYFSSDDLVLSCLVDTLKGLFSKAESWELTDEVRELMLGIVSDEKIIIYLPENIDKNRLEILKEKINDIIGDAMKVVAQYTLPFLNSNIADSELVEEISNPEIDADSYMRSVNALLRTHSVLGQILATRAGTFSADVLLNCITNMVQASGRYAALNHAIATILIHDDESTARDVDAAIVGDHSVEDKLRKVRRIFAFWSVYLSQAGLARYLSNSHAIRALEKLVDDYEPDTGDTKGPFNFTSVLVIARLYSTGKISRSDIETCIKKYGENSAILHLLRVAIHIYTYYMPLEIEEKQWLSAKLGIPVRRIEAQRFRASELGKVIIKSTRAVLPDPKKD